MTDMLLITSGFQIHSEVYFVSFALFILFADLFHHMQFVFLTGNDFNSHFVH